MDRRIKKVKASEFIDSYKQVLLLFKPRLLEVRILVSLVLSVEAAKVKDLPPGNCSKSLRWTSYDRFHRIKLSERCQFCFRRINHCFVEQWSDLAKPSSKTQDCPEALYVFDIGQNDIAYGLRTVGDAQVLASIPDIISQLAVAVQHLYTRGARTFWIHNTGPIGCLPSTLLSIKNPPPGFLDKHGCVESHNDIAKEFNRQLKNRVIKLRTELPKAAITYVDIYAGKLDPMPPGWMPFNRVDVAAGGSTIRRHNETIFQYWISLFALDMQIVQFTQFKARATEMCNQAKDPSEKDKLPRPEHFARALYTIDMGQNDLSYGCVKGQNEMAMEFNRRLKDRIIQLRTELPEASITRVDVYTARISMIGNAKNLGNHHHQSCQNSPSHFQQQMLCLHC
ncbi:hypothetical protein REPUB_Repub09cG0019900 [Reevesia pubescens]